MPNNEVISQALEFQTVPEHVGRVSPNEATFPALVCVQEVREHTCQHAKAADTAVCDSTWISEQVTIVF